MHTTIPATIEEIGLQLAKTAESVRPDQLSAPTPCDEFTVSDLLAHLTQVLAMTERAALKLSESVTPAKPEPDAVADASQRSARAWMTPGAMDGTTDMGFGPMPVEQVTTIIVQELALHGWDLATAVGVPYTMSDAAAQDVLRAVESFSDRARQTGSYGSAIPYSVLASPTDQALAISGRRADWNA
jgi:uncharacterized protein (TIGR03086 family)